jgi:hypothetical protein
MVPKARCILGHNLDVNQGSLSETIEIGTPCNLTTSLIYNWASYSTESPIFIGKNKENFVNLSTITHMASSPFLLLGNLDTKFIVIFSHFHYGIRRDCNSPGDHWCSTFTSWYMAHLATCYAISLFIFGHQ